MNRYIAATLVVVRVAVGTVPAHADVLDLENAQHIALADSPSLQAAEARVMQARARVLQARSAYLPRVDLSASGSKTWLADNTSSSFGQMRFLGELFEELFAGLAVPPEFGADTTDTVKSYSAGITANWTVFNGFGRLFSNAVARFGAEENETAYREAQRLLLDAVARSYYAAQLAREQIEIAEADEAFQIRQLQEAKARRRVGTGSLSDELNFEVRANAAKTTLIGARRTYETVLIGLATLLGLPEAEFTADTTLAVLEPESPADMELPEIDTLIAYAYEHRPDLAQSRLALERARANTWLQRSVFLPQVNATFSHSANSDNEQLHRDEFSTTVAVSLSYNLFAGGLDRARVVEAKAGVKEAKRTLTADEIRVASETRQALEVLRAAQDELRLQRMNAELVRRNRDLVEKGYAAGQESLVRLNEAQRDLVQASARLALARVSLRQAWHDLRTATAETLESVEQ